MYLLKLPLEIGVLEALSEQQTCRPSRSKIKTGEPPIVHDVVHTRCFAVCATWTPSLQQ